MEIRAASAADVQRVNSIDGTLESGGYLHVERSGEGFSTGWRLEERPSRKKLVERNPLNDEHKFLLKQIVGGIEEGIALAAEHDGDLIALAFASLRHAQGTMELIDVRVDSDFRRQGIGTAMMFQLIQEARARKLRAVAARTLTNNLPAGQFMLKTGFELGGIDTHFHSNHDLVKEAATLFWYAALD